MKGSGLNSFYIVVGERLKKNPKIKTPSNRRCCWSSVCTDTYGTRNKICSKKPFRDNQGHLENPYDLEPLRSRPSLNFSEIHAGATWSLLGSGSPIRQDFSDYISIQNIDIRTFSIWTYPGQMDIQTQTRDFYPSCNGPFEGFCGSNFVSISSQGKSV